MALGLQQRPVWIDAAYSVLSQRLASDARRPVCVGFSGGSDSLALLRLAQDWGRCAGRPILALTVDHGLNPQSAAWTAAAAIAAARLGVAWRGLAWKGAKPMRGLPDAARQARHALLAAAAGDVGAHVILMGHTADDVAESDLIRAHTAGHGRFRLFAPSPVWPEGRGVFLLRPLLGARRAELRAWLAAQGLEWLEDPANVDPSFARSRARAALAGSLISIDDATPDVDPDLTALARQVAATADGRLVIDRRSLAQAAPPVAKRLMSAALVCASGGSRPPRGRGLIRLLAAVAAGDEVACTLAGARIAAVPGDDQVVAGRDVGERGRGGLAPLDLGAQAGCVFDGRFDLRGRGESVRIAPAAGLIGRLDFTDRLALRAAPAWARGAVPAVIDADGVVRLPAPWGRGGAVARSLVGQRFAAACGLVEQEAELAPHHAMAL